MTYYAHSENQAGVKHELKIHLSACAEAASKFCEGLAWQQDVRLAGFLHDLGKYADSFQRRLAGSGEHGLDHWSVGAWAALEGFKSSVAALCIQGHHIGLQNGARSGFDALRPERLASEHPLKLRMTGSLKEVMDRWKADGFQASSLSATPRHRFVTGYAGMLEARLAFSALADADFLDTEAHFNGDVTGKKQRPSGQELEPDKALKAVLQHLAFLASSTRSSEGMRWVRKTLLDDALASARSSQGLFTFTAPTGSGKTLAMLVFALAHAAAHRLRRVVLAVPYLSILEQTAKVYREVLEPVFGQGYLLEHHSLAGLSDNELKDTEDERLRRLLSQNWDAPLVLTTNVQLLESLFSNRPSACRKLHRLAKSVILFDEAQTLPLKLALPTLAALSQLADKAHASVVFATATQPAYAVLETEVEKVGGLNWQPREAVPSSKMLFDKSRRVIPAWELQHVPWDMDRLVEELGARDQALCIFNLKRHALELTQRLEALPGLFHLSTNLCPSHRYAVLQAVRECLIQGQACKLVATQCVEAGVDLDFPVVYRALGPLESIAQAAGRCNREGRSDKGHLIVFEPSEDGYPDDAYHQAAAATRALLTERYWNLDLDLPSTYEDYYRRLFSLVRPEARSPELDEAIQAGDFVGVARLYRLIKQDVINVVVPFAGARTGYQDLLAEEADPGINADWMRRAQALAVGIFRPPQGHPAWGVLKPARLRFKRLESNEWFLLNESVSGWAYDETTGLRLPTKGALSVMIG